MNVLIVGSGGREHTLAWKLLQSPNVEKVFCLPGNGGTALLPNCQNLAGSEEDFNRIANQAKKKKVAFVVVGPEAPLAKGITDALAEFDIPVFGPTQAGAQIEASKWWAKELMQNVAIPTAFGETFTNAENAKKYISQQGAPIVVKADGLAAGKGVTVAETVEEAMEAVDTLFANEVTQVVVEEYLAGEEVSVLAVTDGITVRPLLPAQDHKRIGEGDTGPNTGGMGAYAPAPVLTSGLLTEITKQVLQPTIDALRERGIIYQGVLYAGLILTSEKKVKVLEFNCRFGDPETQVILPLLETPLDELILACLEQRLKDFPPLQWSGRRALCVVASAAGYPGSYEKGEAITDLPELDDILVFHAGTCLTEKQQLLTNGGRVLAVTGLGDTLREAADRAYSAIAQINFSGCYYRTDIGHQVLSSQKKSS
ncbi:phosphoribosylamine--glycine ligase [Euhalothece natronophila Z-M001]|uniref:Phosphoribosylamine--glycine ligase n=1 Tax=Euhalothece natronophila Z-M001 TaxID=522448 RepID=A0A5B8NN96_9CHRO|nr:phosphoribosylamine--glycine ligase [Euhalothece natronophila]QDZ40518.1 phosphoribosylamine--glycine ligase [Euhalothece natronophila Z-M001]